VGPSSALFIFIFLSFPLPSSRFGFVLSISFLSNIIYFGAASLLPLPFQKKKKQTDSVGPACVERSHGPVYSHVCLLPLGAWGSGGCALVQAHAIAVASPKLVTHASWDEDLWMSMVFAFHSLRLP
jgi:hypothetical protein